MASVQQQHPQRAGFRLLESMRERCSLLDAPQQHLDRVADDRALCGKRKAPRARVAGLGSLTPKQLRKRSAQGKKSRSTRPSVALRVNQVARSQRANKHSARGVQLPLAAQACAPRPLMAANHDEGQALLGASEADRQLETRPAVQTGNEGEQAKRPRAAKAASERLSEQPSAGASQSKRSPAARAPRKAPFRRPAPKPTAKGGNGKGEHSEVFHGLGKEPQQLKSTNRQLRSSVKQGP